MTILRKRMLLTHYYKLLIKNIIPVVYESDWEYGKEIHEPPFFDKYEKNTKLNWYFFINIVILIIKKEIPSEDFFQLGEQIVPFIKRAHGSSIGNQIKSQFKNKLSIITDDKLDRIKDHPCYVNVDNNDRIWCWGETSKPMISNWQKSLSIKNSTKTSSTYRLYVSKK